MTRRGWIAGLPPVAAWMAGSARASVGRTLAVVLAIAIGVGMGLAVYLINRTALDEFSGAVQFLLGDTDLELRGPREGFDDSGLDLSSADPWYTDADADGYGALATVVLACDAPTGTVADVRLSANVVVENAANAFGNFTNSFAGSVGIGQVAPGFPLNFASANGDKISLFGNAGNHYGLGIQSNLLQIHSDSASSDVAFGYGTSAAMTETMRIKGNGRLGIGTNAPATSLHVNGIDGITIGSSATGQTSVRLSASAATNGVTTAWRSPTPSRRSSSSW
jgi:hypothetical protein